MLIFSQDKNPFDLRDSKSKRWADVLIEALFMFSIMHASDILVSMDLLR